MDARPLAGRRIAVPEARALDTFARMLERRGAVVLRCPLIAIMDAPDPAPVLEWIRRFTAGGCDDLILLTGEGLSRLLECIERHEPGLREEFLRELARVRKIIRGPKPTRVLREIGLKPDLSAEVPTTAGVIACLRGENLRGRRIGVQLYGSNPDLPLTEFLRGAGAVVLPVAPYVYASAADDQAVRALLERMSVGEVDAIAFTSTPQIDRLFAVGPEVLVRAALARVSIAAIGPVVAQSLRRRGVEPAVLPGRTWFLKPFAAALEEAFATASDRSR